MGNERLHVNLISFGNNNDINNSDSSTAVCTHLAISTIVLRESIIVCYMKTKMNMSLSLFLACVMSVHLFLW